VRYCERCGAAFRFARTCPRDNIPTSAGAFDPLIGRVLGERYRILDRIGAGGMGQVYRAAHTRIACEFAVKVVWGDFAYDATMQSRFVREAEVASCLQSRHIVRVIDFAHDAGTLPYLVMEHLDGPTLFDVISREGPIEGERAARIAKAIARGLSHAHDRGIVHRDLKPENVILVTEDDERDVVKILDFGIARIQDEQRLTTMGVSVGTPLYMAPEALSAGEVDARSDLYSLGIVLFEMLTGEPPFNGATMQEIAQLHFKKPPPSIRARLGTGALDDVLRRLLAKRPDDRFSTAREVIEALDPAAVDGAREERPSLERNRPVEEEVIETLHRTITEGAPRYNAGDTAGCYALYRSVAERIIQSGTKFAAVSSRLAAGLLRASTRSNPTDASWDIRFAFDDLFAAEPILVQNDAVRDELAAYASISMPRESEGRYDMLGDYQITFAEALAQRMRASGRPSSEVQGLEEAARRGREVDGGLAAFHAIDPILARARSGRQTTSIGAPPAGSAPPAAQVETEIKDHVHRALRAAAPAEGSGQLELCERIYRHAALDLVARLGARGGPLVKRLQDALQAESGRPPNEAAPALRQALEAVARAR